jgi:hypothetical protein
MVNLDAGGAPDPVADPVLGGAEIGERGVVYCIDPAKTGFQKAQAHEFAMLIGKAHKDRATARRRRAGVVRPPPSRGQARRGIPAGMHLRMRTVGQVAWAMPIADHEDAPLLRHPRPGRKAESRGGPRADAPTPCPSRRASAIRVLRSSGPLRGPRMTCWLRGIESARRSGHRGRGASLQRI